MDEQKKKTKVLPIIIAAVAVVAVVIAAAVFIFGGTGRKLQKQLDLGQKYLSEMDYEQALAAFEAALDIDPMCAEAYEGAITACLEMEDYERAVHFCVRAERRFEEDELEKNGLKKAISRARRKHDEWSGANACNDETRPGLPEDEESEGDEEPTEAEEAEEGDAGAGDGQWDDKATIVFEWNGFYSEYNELVKLSFHIEGTDGTAFDFQIDDPISGTPGSHTAVSTECSDDRGIVRVDMLDGEYDYKIEVEDNYGIDRDMAVNGANHGNIPEADLKIYFTDINGNTTERDFHEFYCRAYTGAWYIGMEIDKGQLAEYDDIKIHFPEDL